MLVLHGTQARLCGIVDEQEVERRAVAHSHSLRLTTIRYAARQRQA